MSTTAVTVEVVQGFDALAALKDTWEAIFAVKPNEPSTSFEWMAAMAVHHVRPGDRCRLVQLRRDGRLIGLVPLVRREVRLLGQRVGLLTPLTEDYNTHSDLLLASLDAGTASALVSGLFRSGDDWDCFRMARLLADNPLVTALESALSAGGHLYARRPGLPAYVLELPDSNERYLADRSAKFRNHLKRTTRKLHDTGTVRVVQLECGDDFESAYTALLDVERASWKQAHGTSITAVGRQVGFYHDFARAAFGAGRLHLQWLTLDGQPVAYNLGYLTGWGYHYLKTSYSHAHRPLGPATVLRASLIESLIAARVPRFDFPGEPYEWEAQWAGTLRSRTVLSAYPATLRGRTLATLEGLRERVRPSGGLKHVDPRAQRAPGKERA